jgi:glutaminyl-tRNA synthetase
VDAQVRLYDRLFTKANPDEKDEGKSFTDFINPSSLEVLSGCKLEPCLARANPGDLYQFERLGYFTADAKLCTSQKLVFNRTVTLRDTWARIRQAK